MGLYTELASFDTYELCWITNALPMFSSSSSGFMHFLDEAPAIKKKVCKSDIKLTNEVVTF